ncbi:MAG: phosphoglucosamine mutase [Haloplanus sp.]
MELFGSSGTRGVVGEEFTPERVRRVAAAAAAVWDADRVAVARDTRLSGGPLTDVAAGTLAAAGADVDRLGVLPTPGVAYYCATEGIPAVHVTASHNPPEYNGIKLLGSDGTELSVGAYERVEQQVFAEGEGPRPPGREGRSPSGNRTQSGDNRTEAGDSEGPRPSGNRTEAGDSEGSQIPRATGEAGDGDALASWDRVGRTRRIDGVDADYRADLLSGIDRDAVAAADLTVAVDPGHGAGSLISPDFVRELGCAVRTVNADPDGRFPGRDPEPIPENLTALQRLVRSTDADVGVAHDGDADRAIFVDERGAVIDGDTSFAALAAAAVEPGDVVVTAVNVSQRLVDAVTDADAELDLTPIGSTHIVTRIRERRGAGDRIPVAGEGNGGVFFPEYRLTRDGAYAAAKFLELLADADAPASEVVAPYTDYHFVRENVGYDDAAELDRLLDAAEAYAREADAALDTTDGYRLDYGDAWLLVRPSGTEPKIRIYAEARDETRAATLASDLRDHLESAC